MNKFELFEDEIYRLKVPFEDIYTSVFALVTKKGSIIFDVAATQNDIEAYVVPAINSLGIVPDYIVCSHKHGDHFGGLVYLLNEFPNAIVGINDVEIRDIGYEVQYLTDGDILLDRYKVLNLKGHTKDSIALYDLENKVLISGDCLQLNGVSKYGTGVSDYYDYKETLERVKKIEINSILAAHDFVPLGCSAVGTRAVSEYIKECESAIESIRKFTEKYRFLSDEEIARAYNLQNKDLPGISPVTIKSIREQVLQEKTRNDIGMMDRIL